MKTYELRRPKVNRRQAVIREMNDEGLLDVDMEEWDLLGELDGDEDWEDWDECYAPCCYDGVSEED
jgi:hypothetical protein